MDSTGGPDFFFGLDFSLETAVHYASYFLTVCLTNSHSPGIVEQVRPVLEYILYQHYSATWDPKRPKRGSIRRSLTFILSSSNGFSPPTPIFRTCVLADIQWFEWKNLLGDVDFDFFVDPGCVSFCRHVDKKVIMLWAADWGPEHLDYDDDETQKIDIGLEKLQS